MSGFQLPLSGLALSTSDLAKLAARPAWVRAELYEQIGLDLLERSEVEARVRKLITRDFRRSAR